MARFQKGERLTPDVRRRLTVSLVLRYNRGESIRQLAESTGRAQATVRTYLQKAGVKFRSVADYPYERRTRMTDNTQTDVEPVADDAIVSDAEQSEPTDEPSDG